MRFGKLDESRLALWHISAEERKAGSAISQGNLYIAETFGGRVQKFRPKEGADPAKLMRHGLRQPAIEAGRLPVYLDFNSF